VKSDSNTGAIVVMAAGFEPGRATGRVEGAARCAARRQPLVKSCGSPADDLHKPTAIQAQSATILLLHHD
jgi:hypothetical protein